MSPQRRSSRLHTSTSTSVSASTRITLNLRHTITDHIRRTTPTIGTFPPIHTIHYPSSTINNHVTSSSSRLESRTPKRSRPRCYRPPPPEAYLIIRAHRRPKGGWGEDWTKKGDGWTFNLSVVSRSGDDGLMIQLEVRDRELKIVPPDDHILSLRLTRIILQCRIISATPPLTGILTPRISSTDGEKTIAFPLGNILAIHGTVIEVRLYDLGLCMTRGRCSAIASLRIS